MTLQELKDLQRGFPPFVACGYVSHDFCHHYVQPVPIDEMAHFKQEVQSTDFNGLSLEQAAIADRYKYMDKLHKPDAINADLERGERLITELKEVGKDTFASRRLIKNNY